MKEYDAIAAYYGERAARRSRVPYIQHIDEGLLVLDQIFATEQAKRAFCLHPFVQEDADLAANHARLPELTDDPHVIVLVMEYRHIANATLSHRTIASAADIPLSPIPDVNAMLVADKVQNYKDFIFHHQATHPRSAELDRYFLCWLERLGVDDDAREALFAVLATRS
jgi:hypothetical protein